MARGDLEGPTDEARQRLKWSPPDTWSHPGFGVPQPAQYGLGLPYLCAWIDDDMEFGDFWVDVTAILVNFERDMGYVAVSTILGLRHPYSHPYIVEYIYMVSHSLNNLGSTPSIQPHCVTACGTGYQDRMTTYNASKTLQSYQHLLFSGDVYAQCTPVCVLHMVPSIHRHARQRRRDRQRQNNDTEHVFSGFSLLPSFCAVSL